MRKEINKHQGENESASESTNSSGVFYRTKILITGLLTAVQIHSSTLNTPEHKEKAQKESIVFTDQGEQNFLQQWCELYSTMTVSFVSREEWNKEKKYLRLMNGKNTLVLPLDLKNSEFGKILSEMQKNGIFPNIRGDIKDAKRQFLIGIQEFGIQNLIDTMVSSEKKGMKLVDDVGFEALKGELEKARQTKNPVKITKIEKKIIQKLVDTINKYTTKDDSSAARGAYEKMRYNQSFICNSKSALLHGFLERFGIPHSGLKIKDANRMTEPHAAISVTCADGSTYRADPTFGEFQPIVTEGKEGDYYRLQGEKNYNYIAQIPVHSFLASEGLTSFGVYYLENNYPKMAERSFMEAMKTGDIDMNEYLGKSYQTLASGEKNQKKKKELNKKAFECIERAVQSFPVQGGYYIIGAQLLFELGEPDKAMEWKKKGMQTIEKYKKN